MRRQLVIMGEDQINARSASASQTEAVVHGDGDVLFAAEVSFGGLDGGVSEQELDLFEVAARFTAELGTGLSQAVAPKRSMPISLADSVTTFQMARSLKVLPTTPLPDGSQQQALHSARR